jgi:hypothetical protein
MSPYPNTGLKKKKRTSVGHEIRHLSGKPRISLPPSEEYATNPWLKDT